MGQLIDQLVGLVKGLRPWVTVSPWEQGVRTRAGRWVKHLLPGLHFLIPFLDTVFVHNVQRRAINLPIQTVTTKDGQCVSIAGGIGYRIHNLLTVYRSIFGLDDALVQHVHAAISAYIVSSDALNLQPVLLATAVTEELRQRFEAFGLSDVTIFISDLVRVRTYRVIADQRYSAYNAMFKLGE